MRTIALLFFIFVTTLLSFDYNKTINYQTFKIYELEQISELSYEIENYTTKNSDDKSIKADMEAEREELISRFLDNLLAGKYDEYDRDSLKLQIEKLRAYRDSLAKENGTFSREEMIEQMTIEVNIDFVKLKLSFLDLMNALKKSVETYGTKDDYEDVLATFRHNLMLNKQLYVMAYNDIMSQTVNKTPTMLDYVVAYDRLESLESVYNIIYVYLEKYLDKLLRTDDTLNYLHIDYPIKMINHYYQDKNIGDIAKSYTGMTIGQVAGIVLTVIVSIVLYLFFFRFVEFALYLFGFLLGHKDGKKERRKHLIRYLELSLRRPLKIFFVVFSIDTIQRIVFITSTKNIDVVFDFSFVYALIAVWALFRLVDHTVIFYGENFMKQYPMMRKELINFFLVFIKIIIVIIATIIVLKNLDYDVSTILASLGIGGLAIALAAREALMNVFGTMQIILDNTFSQGEWIVTDKYQGTVVEIGLRTTKIRTFDNALVSAPNAYLANTEIKNWNKRIVGRRIKMEVGTTYRSKMKDVAQAVEDIREMLRAHPDIADDATEFKYTESMHAKIIEKDDAYGIKKTLLVYIDTLGENSINILIYCFSKSIDWAEWLAVKQDVIMKVAEIFEKNNLEFAFPTRTVYLEGGNGVEHK
jgi:MscS family membrane protein